MRTEPKSRILEAFARFAETSRRGTGSVIGAPEQTSPADHPFRPTDAPELLCGVAVVIAEQAAQSLTTSHLPVRTADAFFRFEQRVPEPLMVALSVIMMDELSDGTAQRLLTEEDHPLQALALDRQNKPFDVSVQIRRTVRQPNDVSSGVLEQIAKLRGELLVAVQDEESLAAQKAVEWVGEIPTDLHHERAVRPRSDSGNVYFSRRQLDDDEHIVGHEPANCGDLDGEEVGCSNGFPMGGEERAPRRPLTSLRRGLDAMFSQNIGDGAPGYRMAESERAPRMRVYPHFGFDCAISTTSSLISAITRGRPGCFRRSL